MRRDAGLRASVQAYEGRQEEAPVCAGPDAEARAYGAGAQDASHREAEGAEPLPHCGA